MIKFFSKIRQQLLSEKRFIKYLIYAIGEIVLVMIGILLALQVNNANNKRMAKMQEITTLKHLMDDLATDTLDMNLNVDTHKKIYLNEQRLLDFLMHEADVIPQNIDFTFALGFPMKLELHQATFKTIENSIGILSSSDLSRKIARFYDFYSSAIVLLENHSDYNGYQIKRPFFTKYFKLKEETYELEFDEFNTDQYYNPNVTKKEMEILNLEEMKQDEAFKITINESMFFRKLKIEYYINVKRLIGELLSDIEHELQLLEE